MNKILLVGNGFDLAHELLTSYNDFLFLMQKWDFFILAYKEKKEHGRFERYLVNADSLDNQKIKKLDEIIKGNSWVHYFCNCGAEIDGWIDFEKEIYPVMELFEFVFKSDYGMDANVDKIYITAKDINFKLLKISEHWKKYLNFGSKLWISKEYGTKEYGVLKKKILKSLKEEFDEFIYAFEIYLHEFVYKNKNIKALKQIKDINADYVISFNYTLTEKFYGIKVDNTHHIHGSIREDLEQGTSNMVLGVNAQKDQNLDFIYFVKYFQRIQKNTGTVYKKFLENVVYGEVGKITAVPMGYELHIYGHSLDVTDEDILKYVIDGARKVYIYRYSQEDFESKVINLIALYGREEVEKKMEKEDFKFVETISETV